MGRAVIQAAADVGVRLTLLDACYLYGGMNRHQLEPSQLRFSDGSVGDHEKCTEMITKSAQVSRLSQP